MPTQEKSIKKVIFISENEELYKPFKRALKAIADIQAIEYSGKFNDKNDVVLRGLSSNGEIDSWMWGEFRTEKKALNPLIVIGFEGKKKFMSHNPVFKAYKEEHEFIQIPFEFNELIMAIMRLAPIYDHVTRKIMVSEYSKGYEHKLITHDLKIMKGDQQATIENFLKVKDFYASKGDKEIARIINDTIKEIGSKPNWIAIAIEAKGYLEDRLKHGSK